MICMLVISHFVGCFWYYVGNGGHGWVAAYKFDQESWGHAYLTSLHWSITQFTPGSMAVQPQNIIERGIAVLVLIGGMIVFSSIVSNITAATNSLKNINAR